MDPVQAAIVKAGEAAVEAGEEAARGFLSQVAGPATAEASLLLQDKVRLYRFRNQVRALGRAQKMMAEAGLEPGAVPLRTLLPLLEGAALEDEPNLAEKWAALLANAAAPNGEAKVVPSFPAILSQLSPNDAGVLDALPLEQDETRRSAVKPNKEFREELGMSRGDFETTMENLQRLCLISGYLEFQGKHYKWTGGRTLVSVSFLGHAFVSACKPPPAR